jgi:pyrroline-5-carboxylate reductase
MVKVGFLGSGKMATALATAIIKSGLTEPDSIICYDVSEEALQRAGDQLQVQVTSDASEVLSRSDIFFLAFKPQNFPDAVADLTPHVRDDHLIVSILAGVRLSQLRQHMSGQIVRVMPNTCCLIGEMAAGFTPAENVNPANLEIVKSILNSAGLAIQVDENQLDAVTGLSGSGPAFVAYVIQQFIAGGVEAGLPYEDARALALKTFSGTANLLQQWQMPPEELIGMVSSPNGTTVAGREILENSDVASVVSQTVLRAAERSRELGR